MWKVLAWLSLFVASLGYSVWVYCASSREPSITDSETVLAGKKVFQQHNCIACHQVYGLGGYLGPDLTRLMSTPGKGSRWANAVIRTGNERMPAYDLTEADMAALLEFLSAVDRSAVIVPGRSELIQQPG
ncbi:MAG: c-type cytochrome [Bacteroidota bacterium]|uniref:c-type cytochrome n=1 Tax=Candidatus Pollutiaquabacter sp. TaxID=3416354 RepID=UPI001A3EF1A4|nr:cytochrome c [Bacteroidota bacterium]MBL7948050.1 cytochrome c [Bacteroidia bacterium]MBP6009848.1 cytochrome c [Bacteroidia bacterium]MBP7269919.1 cytochrome c [Bacteroidia bacterium]MBP7436437.1 cytochrome c [Bacteroidia bacterium]